MASEGILSESAQSTANNLKDSCAGIDSSLDVFNFYHTKVLCVARSADKFRGVEMTGNQMRSEEAQEHSLRMQTKEHFYKIIKNNFMPKLF